MSAAMVRLKIVDPERARERERERKRELVSS